MPAFITTIRQRYAPRKSPEDMRDLAEEYRVKMLEAISDFDDEIMMLYLEGAKRFRRI